MSFELPLHLQKQEEVRWSQVWAVGGMRQRCHAEFCQQLLQNNRTVTRRIVMVKFPILRNGWSIARYTILQVSLYLHVKCSIYGHSSRYELLVNNATSVEKNIKHGFDFGLSTSELFSDARTPACAIINFDVLFPGRTGTPMIHLR